LYIERAENSGLVVAVLRIYSRKKERQTHLLVKSRSW